LLPGSVASEVAEVSGKVVTIEHPTGTFDALIEIDDGKVSRAGIVRTARKLMDGTVFPRSY
jgi:4-oxalomesaconate tautomerase